MSTPGPDAAREPEGSGATDTEFSVALRAAIAARGLTLDRLRHHLGLRGHRVSVATLSYWQSGRSRPERASSLRAIEALEDVLGVASGSLLTPARRAREEHLEAARSTGAAGFAEVAANGALLDELAESLGLAWRDGLRRTSVHGMYTVGSGRGEQGHVWRETIQAEQPGVSRFPVGYDYDDPECDVACFALANARLGRVIDSRESRLVVAELILPRTLEVGESLIIEHGITVHGSQVPAQFFGRATQVHLRDLVLSVTFSPRAVPLSASAYRIVDGVETSHPLVIAGTRMELYLHDFGPGMAGLSWSWGRSDRPGEPLIPPPVRPGDPLPRR